MLLALILTGVLLLVIIHELAHTIVMLENGVRIEEFGIGLPFPFRIKLTIPHYPPLRISPLLIGAYVKPSQRGKETIDRLPYTKQAEIYGAGVYVNLLLGAGLTFVGRVQILITDGNLGSPAGNIKFLTIIIGAVLVWRFRVFFVAG